MDTIEDFAHSLVPHPDRAQILLEAGSQEDSLDRIREVLSSMGIDVVHHEIIHKGDTELLLVHLSSGDMREAVLKITEAGFTRVKGVNAQHKRHTDQTDRGK